MSVSEMESQRSTRNEFKSLINRTFLALRRRVLDAVDTAGLDEAQSTPMKELMKNDLSGSERGIEALFDEKGFDEETGFRQGASRRFSTLKWRVLSTVEVAALPPGQMEALKNVIGTAVDDVQGEVVRQYLTHVSDGPSETTRRTRGMREDIVQARGTTSG